MTKFEQIPDIQVRLEKDFDSNSDLYLGALSPQLQDLLVPERWSLLFKNDCCDVVTPSGRAAAVLHQRSFKVLDRLQKAVPVQFELSAWSVANLRSRKFSKELLSRFTNLELVVLGQRSTKDTGAPKPDHWVDQSEPTFDFEKLLDSFASQHDLAKVASNRHIATPLLEYVHLVRVIVDANDV